jgi:hypothetical protein
VSTSSYGLHVVGRQFYYWRVRADVRGVWERYTPSTHFLVTAPSIAAPFPLRPPNNSSLTATEAHLCWTRVPGAAGYLLDVVGVQAAIPERSTCAWFAASPGNFRWRVAARVEGVRLYTGPYSPVAYFTVSARPTATPQPVAPPTAQPPPSPTKLPISSPTSRPRHAPTHTAGKPAVKRPTALPSATPHPTATRTVTPAPRKVTFTFNGLAVTTVGGAPSTHYALRQPFVVVATFTVHNLAHEHTVQVRVQRLRKRVLPDGSLRLILRSVVTLASHSGRNVYRYTTNATNRGTYRIVLSVTVKGHTKTRARQIVVG